MIRPLADFLRRIRDTRLRPSHIAPTITFLGEQDGPVEQNLKAQWTPLLARVPGVSAAYLARATYGTEATSLVVLCVRAEHSADAALVAALQRPFIATFSPAQTLDIVFLSAAQELEVRDVCMPFYVLA